MTTPQLTRAIEAMTWAASVQGTANNAGCLIDSIAELRALIAQPSVAPPAPGGDVLKELVAAAQIFLTLNNACAGAGRLDRALDALHATQAPTAAQGQDAAPAEQAQAVELLDERGEIRRDLKGSAYCVGNEYKPFHPSASHVRPEWRDGWNACFVAAIRAARAKE